MYKKPSWQTVAVLGMLGTFLYLEFTCDDAALENRMAQFELNQKANGKVMKDIRAALAGQAAKIDEGEPLTALAQKQAKLSEKQSEQITNLEAKTTRLLNVVDRSVKVLDKVKTRQDGRGERITGIEEQLNDVDKRVSKLENALDPKIKPLSPAEKAQLKKLRQQTIKRK